MKKEQDKKRESFWSGAQRGIVWGLTTILCCLWFGGIGVQLWRGQCIDAFNSLLQAGLIFLLWTTTKRMESLANLNALLAEQVQKYESMMGFLQALKDVADKEKAEKKDEQPEPPTFEESQGENVEGK